MAKAPKPPWKHKVQLERRAAAEARQKEYDKLSPATKLAKAGAKQKAKLLKKVANG